MQVDGKSSVERRIAGAFKAASDATGTSFDFLLKTSERESDHRPELGSDTSTAKGLFQFLEQTWFETLRKEGPSIGLERISEKIVPDGKGGFTVNDPKDRAKILALRSDPLVSAVMAGKITQENARRLTEALGRPPSDGELYAAHVLGPAGATKLFRLASTEPQTPASVAFPRAASANFGLFYDKTGRAKTVSELFERLTRMPDGSDPTTARIAAVHTALQTGSQRTDPATVALLLRAQAAATVGQEKPGGATTGLPDAADRALLKTSLSETPIPGASDHQAGRLDGWRSRVARDAFAGLVRDDGTGAQAQAVLGASGSLPGATGSTAAHAALAAARTGNVPAGLGGIPRVDPAEPMSLAPGPKPPPAPAAASLAAIDRAAPEVRPSRILTGVQSDALAAPLPMVDAASGATRPSRLLFGSFTAPSDEALAAGVVRVRTTSVVPGIAPTVAPPPAAASGAVPTTGQTSGASAASDTDPTRITVRRAGARGNRLPLDLFQIARTPGRGRGDTE